MRTFSSWKLHFCVWTSDGASRCGAPATRRMGDPGSSRSRDCGNACGWIPGGGSAPHYLPLVAMTLWIDADAAPQPVKEVCFRASERLGLGTILVANMRLPIPPGYS